MAKRAWIAGPGCPRPRPCVSQALFHKVVRVTLILASSSAIRRQMLDAAGVQYAAVPSAVDEAAAKAELTSGPEIALALAKAKALDVASSHPEAWVIGSDSVV